MQSVKDFPHALFSDVGVYINVRFDACVCVCSTPFSPLGDSKAPSTLSFPTEEGGARVALAVMASYWGMFVFIICSLFACVSTEVRQFGTVSVLKGERANK